MATQRTIESMLDRIICWMAATYGETAALEIGVWNISLLNFYSIIRSNDDDYCPLIGESSYGSADLTTALESLLDEIVAAESRGVTTCSEV